MFMKSFRIICSLIALLFITTACNQDRVKSEPTPQKKSFTIRGYIDNGDGQLVEFGTLKATSLDGIHIEGAGSYFFNDQCTLRIYRTEKKKVVDNVTFTYTAGYLPTILPTSPLEYNNRQKPDIPNADPDDIYFKFLVIGDVTMIVKTKDAPEGVDVGRE